MWSRQHIACTPPNSWLSWSDLPISKFHFYPSFRNRLTNVFPNFPIGTVPYISREIHVYSWKFKRKKYLESSSCWVRSQACSRPLDDWPFLSCGRWSDNQMKPGKVKSFLTHLAPTLSREYPGTCSEEACHFPLVLCVNQCSMCVFYYFFSLPLKAFAYFTALKGAAEERPLLWAVYVVVLLLPVLLISICLCPRSGPIKVLCFIYLIFL